MTRLLIIAPQNPYPATDGGKIGIYYPIIHLAKYFEVHFVCIAGEELRGEAYAHFKEQGIAIYPQVLNTKDRALGYFFNFFQQLPYKFLKYYNNNVYEEIARIVDDKKIKHVWCNHPHVASYALKLKQLFHLNIYLREHNIEFSLVQQVMEVSKNPLLKFLVGYQARKTKWFEMDCWKRFNKVYFISDSDLFTAKTELSDEKNFGLLYDSFKTFERSENVSVEQKSFIFTASVATFQNAYNLKQFVHNIWFHNIKKRPDWRLYLTGNSDEALKKVLNFDLNHYGIYNLGFVSDIAHAIQSKKYFISPSYMGSGVRIKVLNALSMGAVSFVTPLDAAMLNVLKHKKNVLVYNDFLSFDRILTEIELNDQFYDQISLRASTIGNNFSWTKYAEIIYNDISSY